MYFHRVTEINKPKIYRDFIDSLVDNCHSGQGQIEPDIVRDGVWYRNEPRDLVEHQNELHELLKRMNSKAETARDWRNEEGKQDERHEQSPKIRRIN